MDHFFMKREELVLELHAAAVTLKTMLEYDNQDSARGRDSFLTTLERMASIVHTLLYVTNQVGIDNDPR